MRRAGYDVRVLPEEDLGWEENPPTVIEFIRRDQRWCQGTLQYVFFAGIPGLEVVSRFQLLFAMLMFLGSPAWIGLLLVSTLVLAATPSPVAFVDTDYGAALLATILVMWFAPKIATIVNALSRPVLRRRFGGTFRFLVGIASETTFFLLLSPIMWMARALFLAGLPFGRAIGWIGQVRNDHSVSWSIALRYLWPQTTLGTASLILLGLQRPEALPYVFVLWAGGLALSIPLCVITSRPSLGMAFARMASVAFRGNGSPGSPGASRASSSKGSQPVTPD